MLYINHVGVCGWAAITDLRSCNKKVNNKYVAFLQCNHIHQNDACVSPEKDTSNTFSIVIPT